MGLELTVDEIVETLKRSSLTTVIVEGKDDVLIYRWIEDEIGITNASFFPCGGRGKLLKVFERKNEFSHIKTVFVADKDCYVYNVTPIIYDEILWTHGYSIENDLYHGKQIERLLSKDENKTFLKSLNSFIEYYAFEVENFLNDRLFCFKHHPQKILCDVKHELKVDFLQEINFTTANDKTKSYILENYDTLIRGKSLFALLTRILSHSHREIKHSKNSLLEHCYRTHRSEQFISLITEINSRIRI
ncbi:MAG: DUF4435 domain-containing protein [Bacteroidota bacterium]